MMMTHNEIKINKKDISGLVIITKMKKMAKK